MNPKDGILYVKYLGEDMNRSIDKKMQVRKRGQMEDGGHSFGYMYEEGIEKGGSKKKRRR